MKANSKTRIRLRTLKAAVIWALVPLTVWAGRPLDGCICADGSYKLICPKLFGKCRAANLPACCCREKPSSVPVRTCCINANRSANGSSGVQVQACQCKLVPNAVVAKAAKIDDREIRCLASPLDVAVEATNAAIASFSQGYAELVDAGPPPDLVVQFRHFII